MVIALSLISGERMAQLDSEEVVLRAVQGDADPAECVLALVLRDWGRVDVAEGPHIDFKERASLVDDFAVAELARDVLGFSNSDGGIILVGVTNAGEIIGHTPVDSLRLRERLGPYVGTRLDYEIGNAKPVLRGRAVNLPFLLVRGSSTAYPNLLRRDIAHPSGFGRKIKYAGGSLFYREGAETRVEPADGDVNARAVELHFTGASPRTRSSFVLAQDRPGVRLYAHINDRFFGREAEAAELTARFDDVRGRGISIAGQGGIGKTELAIEIVDRLYKTGRFKSIYSASAKTILLGPAGAQPTDPIFHDFPSFLKDLLAWLGFDAPPIASAQNMEDLCLSQLTSRPKTLLFVDNLETVDDARLFNFLDNRIPRNVWLITTSRVHRVKNWVYAMQLGALEPRDAAHHLRHELKRQGLQDYASSDIRELEGRVELLHRHPLAIRWYAWECRRDPSAWQRGPGGIPKDDLESFCVGHTLRNLPHAAQKVLAAIATTEGHAELTLGCIAAISGVSGSTLESCLYELECAGLLSAIANSETGRLSYSAIPLASRPSRDLARKNHWEDEFARNLHGFVGDRRSEFAGGPLLRDLVEFDARQIRDMDEQGRQDLKARIERANKRPHGFRVELLHLLAECERRSKNIITADDLYGEAAGLVLESGKAGESQRYQGVLLEAATVARNRSHAEPQIRRAIGYLKAIESTNFHALRILGSLTELHAMICDREGYTHYLRRVTNLRHRSGPRFSPSQLQALDEALERARESLGRCNGGPRRP
jgi:AAA ATPase domain/Schlafen, AlbA_2